MSKKISVRHEDRNSVRQIQEALKLCLDDITKKYTKIAYVCIGTDRSTGDSLGPLVGYKLKQFNIDNVYGDLEYPVHAKNIQDLHFSDDTLVIAIDACIGRIDHVGNILIGTGPLKPGAGVGKNLPAIGDIHIAGIVNLGGTFDISAINSTRLFTTMRMADLIAESIESVMVHLDQAS